MPPPTRCERPEIQLYIGLTGSFVLGLITPDNIFITG